MGKDWEMQASLDWQQLRELGAGGQSTVYLVRKSERQNDIEADVHLVQRGVVSTVSKEVFIEALKRLVQGDPPSELGALKIFDKSRNDGAAPIDRIRTEISILGKGIEGLPRLLDSNAEELWMVTEFFPKGSLERNLDFYKGDASRSLVAFREFVKTIAQLHGHSIVHRDIKPANVFVSDEGRLVPGDFGIAHTQGGHERATQTGERVGPRDYMPQWGDLGERLEDVAPSFDVYMLGKLLWCMVAGRLRLPREYHRRESFNLETLFATKRNEMAVINYVLDRSVVENEHECPRSASLLLHVIDRALAVMMHGWTFNDDGKIAFPCLNCRTGIYKQDAADNKFYVQREDSHSRPLEPLRIRVYNCGFCGHEAFFSTMPTIADVYTS